MIDQQFIDYIRRQLAAGVAREDIKKALRINGLSEQDMAEGFAAVETAPSSPTPVPSAGPTVLSQPIPAVMPTAQAVAPAKAASLWAKAIPRTNWTSMVLSLLLVFGLDLFIIITDHSLRSYWYIMLGVFAAFAVFFCLENFVFRNRFAGTTSALDKWIYSIIILRNSVFLLNFIPFIQILGLILISPFLAIMPGRLGRELVEFGSSGTLGILDAIAPALLVLYVILIAFRFSTTNKKQIVQAS